MLQLSGVGIIAAGAVVLGQFGGLQHFLEDRILAPPIVLIVAGSIVFLVAFLGCCGAIKENYLMLMAVSRVSCRVELSKVRQVLAR